MRRPGTTQMISALISILEHRRAILVRVLVNIATDNASAIRSAVLSALQEEGHPEKAVLDFGRVTHIDGSGLRMLLELGDTAKSANIHLVVCGLGDQPRQVVETASHHRQFDVCETLEQALQLQSPPSAPKPAAAVGALPFIPPERRRWSLPDLSEKSPAGSSRLPWMAGCLLAAAVVGGGVVYRYYPLRGNPAWLDKRPGSQTMVAEKNKQAAAPEQEAAKTDANRRVETPQGRIEPVEKLPQSANAQLSPLPAQLDRTPAETDPPGESAAEPKADPAEKEAKSIDGRRVNFELGVHHERELAPGINVRVERTDVDRQRFDGWISLIPGGRTLTLHDRRLQQPVVFYAGEDHRPRQLVITRVTKYSVIGYLVLPRGGERRPQRMGARR